MNGDGTWWLVRFPLWQQYAFWGHLGHFLVGLEGLWKPDLGQRAVAPGLEIAAISATAILYSSRSVRIALRKLKLLKDMGTLSLKSTTFSLVEITPLAVDCVPCSS